MQPMPVPPQSTKTNKYALLSPINSGLALLGNCISLFAIVVPGMPFVCAAVSGAFSLSGLATGMVGLLQVNRASPMQKGKGLAISGIILGLLGLMAACLIPLLGTALLGTLGLQIGNILLVPAE
jgi:hypothetical protein